MNSETVSKWIQTITSGIAALSALLALLNSRRNGKSLRVIKRKLFNGSKLESYIIACDVCGTEYDAKYEHCPTCARRNAGEGG